MTIIRQLASAFEVFTDILEDKWRYCLTALHKRRRLAAFAGLDWGKLGNLGNTAPGLFAPLCDPHSVLLGATCKSVSRTLEKFWKIPGNPQAAEKCPGAPLGASPSA